MGERVETKDWYKQERDIARFSPCAKPYENIIIGTYPSDGMTQETADSFDAIVNVSCTSSTLFYPSNPNQRTYFVPVLEMGVWNYSAFVSFFMIMEHHHKLGHRIYVHCAAGAYRSPTMTMIWLKATKNMSWRDADRISNGRTEEEYKEAFEKGDSSLGRFRLRYFWGNMPPNFNEFLCKLGYHIAHEHSWAYSGSLDDGYTRTSNDREVRARIQGYSWSSILLRPFRKIGYFYRELREWAIRLWMGVKTVQVDRGMYSTCQGDDWFRKWRQKRVLKYPTQRMKDLQELSDKLKRENEKDEQNKREHEGICEGEGGSNNGDAV